MVLRTLITALLLGLVTLAGCTDDAPPEDDDFDDDLEATDDTGIIRGVVVSPSIVPVPNVQINVVGTELTTTTNQKGAFGFDGIDPGTHFLETSKIGWESVRTDVIVEAGVDDPPVKKIQIVEDPDSLPTFEVFTFEGRLQCGAGVAGGAVNPCAVIDIATETAGNGVTYPVPKMPDIVHAELVWESTSTLGDSLYLGMEEVGSVTNSDFAGGEGPSPVVVRATSEQLIAGLDGEGNLTMTIFPGSDEVVTGHISQSFQLFTVFYYGWEPEESYTLSEDGEPVVPS